VSLHLLFALVGDDRARVLGHRPARAERVPSLDWFIYASVRKEA
jgi:hypothetical protein